MHGTPTVLELGHILGGTLGYTYTPKQIPSFRLQFRIQAGDLIESTLNWNVSHLEVHGTGLLGWQIALGRAGFTFWLGGGGSLIKEVRLRHQAQRLSDSNRDLNQTAYLTTAHLSGELELELPLVSYAGFLVRGGPQYRWVDDPWGWTLHLGAFWRFN
jgi:hypothetical protein